MPTGELAVDLFIDDAWIAFGDDVLDATWTKGRKKANEPWPIGSAVVTLIDDDRRYDPLDSTNIYAGDLVGGTKVRIRVRRIDTDPWSTVWRGYVDKFTPASFAGGNLAVTTMRCNGAMFALATEVPDFAGDLVAERLSTARAGAFYTFNTSNGGLAGRVEDFSGRGADGVCYPDEFAAPNTPGSVVVTPGKFTFGGETSIVAPLPADPIRGSTDGFLFVGAFNMSTAGPIGSSWRRYTIFNEGIEDDAIFLYLEQTLATPGVSADTDAMRLWCYIYDDASIILTLSATMGTRADWVGRDRCVYLAMDSSYVSIGAAAINGDGLIGGVGGRLTRADSPLRGNQANTPAPSSSVNRVHRVGLSFRNDGSQPGFEGDVDVVAIAHGPASFTWLTTFQAAVIARGFIGATLADRAEQLRTEVGLDASLWSEDITSSRQFNEYSPIGGRTAIQLLRAYIAAEQGRLYQRNDGDIRLEDFAAAQTKSTTNQAVYTDQQFDPGVDTDHFQYLDGSAPIDVGLDQVVNQAILRLPTGYTWTAVDQTSIDGPAGLRSKSYNVELASEAEGRDYINSIVDRFGTQRAHISAVTLEPDDDPARYWPEMIARDVGDRVTIERQPLNIGPVSAVPSIIEGTMWTYGQDNGFRTTFYTSHAGAWDGFTY